MLREREEIKMQTVSSAYRDLSGIKCTFVNMPLRESAQPNTPPEGPLILASILRKNGAEPRLLDLNAYRTLDQTRPELINGRHLTLQEAESLFARHLSKYGDQDIVAFSGMITTLRWQEAMAQIVKKLQPECFLVTGGGLATELRIGLFKWIPHLDAVAHSEGDESILIIANDVKAIKEFGFRKAYLSGKLSSYCIDDTVGKFGRFLYAGKRPQNLDEIPYGALDLLENDPDGRNLLEEIYIPTPVWGGSANNSSATSFTMERSLTTVSSRGCPYACSFCYRGAQGERNYRMRSAKHLADQVQNLINDYHLDFIGHPDDNFGIDRKRITELPDVYKKLGINIRWGTHTRLDEADDRVVSMAEAGCVYIGFGAESASPPVIQRMNKGGFILKNGITPVKINGETFEFPTTMVTGIKNCQNYGIHANCTWIMGYPGETLTDLQTSVAFILWQQQLATEGFMQGSEAFRRAFDSVNRKMFTATAYPGTEMFRDPYARALLQEHFRITFDELGEPVCDETLHQYILELDDATKVLHNNFGIPLNFGALNPDQFLLARSYIDNDQIEKILDM